MVIVLCFCVIAQQLNRELRFRDDGTFKIVQFTDIHYQNGSPKNDRQMAMIARILDSEKPDMAVLTGDIVTSSPVESGWRSVVEPFIERKIPWAVTLGNHDDHYNTNREDIISFLKKLPWSLVQSRPKFLGGSGNYLVRIRDSRGQKNALLIYCLDSNGSTPIKGVGKYGWFKFEQIRWFRQRSLHFRELNNHQPVPGAVFFHIPLPEFSEVWGESGEDCVGTKKDDICAPAINSGLFASLRESEGVMGVFVGHDHNNDFAGTLHDICCAYGRVSGYDAYGVMTRGARVIEFIENEKEFNSWIRTGKGDIVNRFSFPKSF